MTGKHKKILTSYKKKIAHWCHVIDLRVANEWEMGKDSVFTTDFGMRYFSDIR